MKTVVPLLLIVAFAAAVGLAAHLQSGKALQRYWQRGCTGKDWRRRFPEATKDEIRRFLQIFVDAFGFRSTRRLKFNPDDEVMAVYRAVHPEHGLPDSMELEGLMLMVEKEYGVDLKEAWHKGMTLGTLFQLTQPNQLQPSAAPNGPSPPGPS